MKWNSINTIPKKKCLVLTKRWNVFTAIPDADGYWCTPNRGGWKELSISDKIAWAPFPTKEDLSEITYETVPE